MTTPPQPARSEKLAKARAYKVAHRKEILDWQRKYNSAIQADPAKRAKKRRLSRESMKRHYAKWRAYDKARDPIKQRARGMVRNHIWRGTLKRLPCEVCGSKKSHAHHHDYSKPLEVKWLCAQHHTEEHHV